MSDNFAATLDTMSAGQLRALYDAMRERLPKCRTMQCHNRLHNGSMAVSYLAMARGARLSGNISRALFCEEQAERYLRTMRLS